MEPSPKSQIVELIKQSKQPLILTHESADGDAIGSSLATYLTLKKLGKDVTLVISGNLDSLFSFLPGFDQIKNTAGGSDGVVFTIDVRHTGDDLQLGYKKIPDSKMIKVIVTPKQGSLRPQDVSIESTTPKHDLILILDCSSLDRLGSIVEQHSDLFYETPTVSIDHHSSNTNFAKVNWVDITASSTSEMLISLIEALSRQSPLLDADIATALLTGLVTDTGSFQNYGTTPKTLTVAAQLVASGARHQEIMSHLRAKDVARLKLWGRALSRVAADRDGNFIWTKISLSDSRECGLEPGNYNLIDELLKTVGEADFVALLTEYDGYVSVSLRSTQPNFDSLRLASQFGGGGHPKAAAFKVEGDLAQKESEIIEKLRHYQVSRLAQTARHDNG